MPQNTNSQNLKPVVFVFTTAYVPFIGGAEVAIIENIKRLADKFVFFVFTSRFERHLPREEKSDGATIIRLGFGKKWDKFLLPVAAFLAAFIFSIRYRRHPRIFWAVMASYGAVAAATLKIFFPRVPYILTLQEGDTEKHIRTSRLYLVNLLGFRYSLVMCDYVTAISSYLADLARRFNYQGQIQVIPNGVDFTNFNASVPEKELNDIRRTLGLKGDEKILITSSRLVVKNGLDTVIRALPLLKEKRKGLKLKFLILGTGPEAHNLKDLARLLGVLDNILFVGHISHTHLSKYLKLADVFVRPSRSEGLGNSFLEAMAAGVPIIGTLVGGITDFLFDGKTGLAVETDNAEELADKIFSLFENQRLREDIAEGARRFIFSRYDWEMIARDFLSLFGAEIEKSKNPRILIATGIFPPDIGGPATYSRIIAEELTKRNFGVRVITYADVLNSKSEIRNPKSLGLRPGQGQILNLTSEAKILASDQIPNTSFRIFKVSRGVPKGLRHLVYFWKCLNRGFHSDIIYAQDAVSAGLPSLLAAKLLRKKYIVKITGDYAWEQGVGRFDIRELIEVFQLKKYGWQTEFLRFLQSFAAGHADLVVTPSFYLKDLVTRWGILAEKISVIYNAAEPNEHGKKSIRLKESLRKELGIKEDEKIIISVGRLVKWKGFDTLIEVVADLKQENLRCGLVIIGSGPEKERLEEKVKNLDLVESVVLLGSMSREKVGDYLRASDVFVLNTAYEGFSHQIVEAMEEEVPVITTAIGGNTEIIRDGENGLLTNYNDKEAIKDAILIILNNRKLGQKLVLGGLKTSAGFTKEKMVRGLLEEIDKIQNAKFKTQN